MYLRFAIFFGIMLVLVVSGHVYLYRRLIRDTTDDRRLRLLGVAALGTLGVLMVVGRLLQRLGLSPVTELTGGIGYVWMGAAMFIVLTLLAIGGTQNAIGLVRKVRSRFQNGPRQARPERGPTLALELPVELSAIPLQPEAPPLQPELVEGGSHPLPASVLADPSRRLFLSRAVAGSAVTLASGLASYGVWRAYHPPDVSEVHLRIPKLPKALEGFTLVQLTDIHVGNLIERTFLQELVRRANAQKPDLVAITGDLVDGDVPTLGSAVGALSGLKSRYGTHFVTGNHDYYSGADAWCGFLSGLGINVLRNRRLSVGDATGKASFDLLGVDDWLGGRGAEESSRYDLDKTIAGRDPDRASILLAHQPANFEVVAQHGIDLQLSGHTHGGQLFPMTLLVGLTTPYTRGLYAHGGSHIYVSRGCGFWGPPMRVGSPPEILKLVLTT